MRCRQPCQWTEVRRWRACKTTMLTPVLNHAICLYSMLTVYASRLRLPAYAICHWRCACQWDNEPLANWTDSTLQPSNGSLSEPRGLSVTFIPFANCPPSRDKFLASLHLAADVTRRVPSLRFRFSKRQQSVRCLLRSLGCTWLELDC